jgi:NAD(P)-dependent dehydrogenase (short-subunit alcohol dehydrogenase family)
MTEKIALITGSTEGIGKATAMGLAKIGYRVILHGRNAEKTKKIKEEIALVSGNKNIDILVADLSSLEQVQKMAQYFKSKYSHLDLLINNAGLMNPERKVSQDGFELNFQVNYLSHFLLTNLLLEPIKKAPQGRIVNVTSSLYHTGKVNFDDLQSSKNYSLMTTYNTTKLFLVYFTLSLSEKLKSTNVTANCLHPGVVNTRLARDFKGPLKWIFAMLTKVFFISPEKGAENSLFVATSSTLANASGNYFENKKIVDLKPIALIKKNQEKIWSNSQELIKAYVQKSSAELNEATM